MLPFDSEPTDWRDLQNLVGQLFEELGCNVRVSETVDLVRGKKEIDVLAVDASIVPSSIYAIECKNWSSRVPQEVAHSFRTIVADLGAHHGFIISKAGFQSGAYQAVEKTNVTLLSFLELQQLFVDRWLASIAMRCMPLADALFPYWDPSGGKRPPPDWGAREQESMHRLADAYQPFITLGPMLTHSRYRMRLPMTVPVLDDRLEVVGTKTIATFRQFYDFIETNAQPALERYRRLFGEAGQGDASPVKR